MSVANIINANEKITPSYIPTILNVGSLETGPGLAAPSSVPVTLPATGLYALVSYLRKGGAGAVDATSSSVFYVASSGGFGECRFTPQMSPPVATESGVPTSLTGIFYSVAGATTLQFQPGTALNLGATGNAEAQLWYLGNSQANS